MNRICKFILTTLLLCASQASLADNITRYVILVDAGSSGSRLHLYQYTMATAIPVITEIFNENVKPGLSSYASDPQDAGASLSKPIADALQVLVSHNVDPRTVNINVLATAGMRLLPQDTQNQIYASVTSYIKTNTVFRIDQITTIPGNVEALYGWVDVNYLSQTFQNKTPSVGSIDMGGASTQIAFATSDTTHPDNELNFKINHQYYTVFVQSFLGLGQDQAYASMLQAPTDSTCFPSGYSDSKVAPGNFSYSNCQSLYSNIIQSHNVSSSILPTAGQNFIAYSGSYYDLSFFGVTQTPDPQTVAAAIQNVCNESWGQLKSQYPTDKYLSGYCANGIYVSDLLFNYYQLNASQLTVEPTINQMSIDWTEGALLYKIVRFIP